ncbi:glycerophosphodiester phosphodiesterase 1 isoform X2 [Pezoporus wallicus]|uniref:glycerophosphodiester phosphodiesterase 1 isoform X2 n=1 Tax=Pezoporus wallicus TaxID=35540 RepID=UPI00254E67BB|nr:glycerophosphodiester phosphodiesterase 1 isoform X2 [Pezoporus wallicus]XP_061329294.1 glycerophosphodiester phosphodiesterase 1 isoform X2 [Pezoporus flaviventris]
MLCRGEGLLGSLTALLVVALALSRSPALSGLLTAGLYLALHLFSLEPAAPQSAQRVLRPRGTAARIAHRGGAHDAPENTLAAIRQAAENGATGVELDLEFTADGVPILMHDETVERTTDGSGRLRDLTFEEIRRLNPSAKHRLWSKFQGEKVPTLREAVVESMQHNLIIYFDVKGHANQMRQADRNVVTALTHRPWQLSHFGDGTPRFSSSWKHHLYMMLDVILDWSLHSFLWRLCGVSALLVQKNFVSQDYVRHWSSKGIQVVAWTVNTFAEKSYYESVLESNYITDSLVEDCEPHY